MFPRYSSGNKTNKQCKLRTLSVQNNQDMLQILDVYTEQTKIRRCKMGTAVCRDWKIPHRKNFTLSRNPTPIPTPHSRSVVLYILSPRPPLLATLYFRQVHRDFKSPCISKLFKQMFPKVISDFSIHNTNSNSKFYYKKTAVVLETCF